MPRMSDLFGWVPYTQRRYLRSHPLAWTLALGIALTVTWGILFPSTVESSPATLVLPDWLNHLFEYLYAIGGWAAFIGLIRGKTKWEALGMVLLTSGLVTQFLAVAYLDFDRAWPGGLFLLLLALGTALRAHWLAYAKEYFYVAE